MKNNFNFSKKQNRFPVPVGETNLKKPHSQLDRSQLVLRIEEEQRSQRDSGMRAWVLSG